MWIEVLINEETRLINLNHVVQIFNLDGRTRLELNLEQGHDFLSLDGDHYSRIKKFLLSRNPKSNN
jgi:hypothetical protein